LLSRDVARAADLTRPAGQPRAEGRATTPINLKDCPLRRWSTRSACGLVVRATR